MLDLESEDMRGPDFIPTEGNILSLDFISHSKASDSSIGIIVNFVYLWKTQLDWCVETCIVCWKVNLYCSNTNLAYLIRSISHCLKGHGVLFKLASPFFGIAYYKFVCNNFVVGENLFSWDSIIKFCEGDKRKAFFISFTNVKLLLGPLERIGYFVHRLASLNGYVTEILTNTGTVNIIVATDLNKKA